MSALITASTQYLSGDIGAGLVDTSDHRLIAVWLKWVGTGNHNSENNGLYFRTASGNAFMSVTGDNTPLVVGKADHPNSAIGSVGGGTMTENAWFLAGVYLSPEVVGFSTLKVYRDAASNSNGFGASAITTTDMREIFLGQSAALGGFSFWKGRIAEASVWSVTGSAQADAIMAELLTTPADAVTGGYTPLFYASLESGVTAEIGSALTNNGTVTFDAGDHPSLSAGDTTAPTLTSPTATTTGSTTATGSVTTDEANGTLYRLASTNATETAATVVAAALSQSVTTTGAQAVSFTGLTASTTYYAHYVQDDAASNRSARVSSSSFTTSTPDTTAPTLSSGVGTVKSNALIVVGATTNEANGTMYVVVTTSATAPSAAQVKAGQNNGGTAAVFAANQSISSTGAKTFNATGFTQLTGYYPYIVHTDAAGNDSSVLSVGLRTTFRNGATAQYVIDNTAAVGGNPAGALYALALTKSADDWMAYRTISGPTPGTGTLTENADGSFTFVGPDAALWVIQPEVNGVDDAGGQITIELYDQASDVTPPTLTTATGTKTGATTATGTVTTSEGLGTLYYLTNTSATALSAAVLAGSTQTVTTSGVQNISRTGLTASTTYYHHFLHKDPAGNDSAVLSSNSFTTDAVADVTPPTLTSPTGAALGSTSSAGSVSTNEANGTLYWLTNTSATATDAAIKAANSQAVTATGVQFVTSGALTASTVYYNHFLHRDAAGNDSTRSTSASFTTSAAPTGGGPKGSVVAAQIVRPICRPIVRPMI